MKIYTTGHTVHYGKETVIDRTFGWFNTDNLIDIIR